MDTTSNPNGPGVELDKVIALFTGPNSADLYERHVAAINRLCRSNSGGFAIRDLPKVQKVLELSLALLKRGTPGFVDSLCELVSTLGKPFIRRTSTDEFKMLSLITNVLTAVGDIFRSPGLPAQLLVAAAQMITAFANAYGHRPNALELAAQQQAEPDVTQRQYHTNQSLLNKSGVVADIITALARCLLADLDASGSSPSAQALAPITVALLALSYNPENCASMVEGGVLQCLAALLARGAHSETTCAAVELLWNVAENAPSARELLSQPLPSLQTLARGGDSSGGGGGGGALGAIPPCDSEGPASEAGDAAAPSGAAAAVAGPGPGSSARAGRGTGDGGEISAMPSFASMSEAGGRWGGGGGGGGSMRRSTGAVSHGGGGGGLGQPAGPGFGLLDGGGRGAGRQSGLQNGGGGLAAESSIELGPAFRAARGSRGSVGSAGVNTGGGVFQEGQQLPAAPDLPPRLSARARGGSATTATAAPPPPAPSSTSAPAADTAAALTSATAAAAAAPVVQPLATALTGLIRSLLLSGFSRADKELRNDVMVAANLLLQAPDFRAAAAAAGAFEPLLAAATAPELATRPDLVAGYALTTDTLDHELRLLVWGALEQGCLLPEVLAAAVAAGLMRVLLLYVSYGDSHPAVRRWNADQLASLRSAALSKLHSLSPLCPEEYERAGGPATLLGFVSAAPGAVHLEGALRHLHRLFVLVPETRDSLGGAGLIPVLLGVVRDSVGSGAGGGGALGHVGAGGGGGGSGGLSAAGSSSFVAGGTGGGGGGGGASGQPEPVRLFALLCLTALCTVHAENQRRLRKAGGVGVLLSALAKLRGLDPLLPAPYAIAVLECIWAAVVPDRKSTARFLVDQGMDQLLNHLESGNQGHRPVVLRVLSDLLENPRSHPFFHEWQSDANKQTAAHMLLSIWMEEDAMRGMTGADGLLANPSRPLAGLEKRTKWLPAETVAYGNMSADKRETLELMSGSVTNEVVLAKIYGVFKLLGFESCPYLSPRDHAVLAAVEKYAKFRQGDVWRGIQEEFDACDMRPTAPDRIRLESGIELSESLAAAVRDAQARLLGRAQEGLRAAETRLFDGLRAQAKLEAEYRYVQLQERTPLTLAEMRRAKEQKAAMLKNSLQSFQFQHGQEEEEGEGEGK
ncbi:hypothetical protein Agub_g1947 [Astrephomene gubernaculifera]|uniref:Cilia- and flagella-associated protein 69 ARM repeats domain-containing protein n=1 Tax=Astrephomene gubernaculifera TaxID=47775 RepID=A0AAD3HHQ3_9CHLO|nr:hypothetical protein Agub_g1947 [Astrephomene gubernaculifera]